LTIWHCILSAELTKNNVQPRPKGHVTFLYFQDFDICETAKKP